MAAGHIVLVISSLGGGGAERVIADIAGYLGANGRRVTVLTLDGESRDAYAVPSGVDRARINIMWPSGNALQSVVSTFRRLALIRRAVLHLKPDVVISFIDTNNVRVLAALLATRIPVIVSERCDPTRNPIGRSWTLARRLIYPTARAIVVQTERVARWYGRWLGASRVTVIPNAVRTLPSPDREARPPAVPESGRIILAMGRLVPQKGFDLLIRAFASMAGQFEDWRVVILGDGPDRNQLAGLARSLGVERQVTFAGYQPDPLAWLRRASLFVLSSRFEGFPNALLEAMQCGLPVIAFDCASGPSEIVRHGTDGLLVPPEDVPGLAKAMIRMASDEELRRSLARRATEVADRFPPGKIYASWLALCDRSAREPARA